MYQRQISVPHKRSSLPFFFLKKKKKSVSRKVKYNVFYQKAPMPSQEETVQQAQTATAAFPSPAGLLVHSHEDEGTSLITRAATAVPPPPSEMHIYL